jgi:hypothetical protein
MIYNCIVEIWRAPLIDSSYGRKWDWDNSIRIVSVPGSYQPILPIRIGGIELIDDRETTVTKARAYIRPLDVEIRSTDRLKVSVDKAWWDIHSEPSSWVFGRSKSSHIRILIQKVEH